MSQLVRLEGKHTYQNAHCALCRGFGCELKKVRKIRLGPTCQGLLSQEAAFQAKWEKDLFVLAAAETSQTWTFYTQRRLLTDTVLPQRLKDALALKYLCLLFKCSDHHFSLSPPHLRDVPQYARQGQYLHLSLRSKYKVVCSSYSVSKRGIFRAVGLHLFLGNHELTSSLLYFLLNCELD